MAVQVGQVVVEAIHTPDIADVQIRTAQVVVETIHTPDIADVQIRTAQVVVEPIYVAESANIKTRVAQVFLEVIYKVGATPPPPPPPEEQTRMPALNASLIGMYRDRRFYVQFEGTSPQNPLYFAGVGTNHFVIQGVNNPNIGGVDPVYVHDPRRNGRFIAVNRTKTPPDLPTFDVVLHEAHGAIPRQLITSECPLTYYEMAGACRDLSDPNAWSDYVMVYRNGLATDRDEGDRSTFDEDGPIEATISYTGEAIYRIGGIIFGEKGRNDIDREVLDAVYGATIRCSDCGVPNDGSKWIYAITKSSGSGSPGLPAELVYTVDGGATIAQATITGIGANEDPIAIEIVGDKLVVLSRTAGSATTSGYYYATINYVTGVPGVWTKVTSGFVANRQANDIYVASPSEVFFVADGGYIYKSADIQTGVTVIDDGSATTNNLYRVHGKDDTIVAVGGASTVLRSLNRGVSFANSVSAPAGTPLDIRAVAVQTPDLFWVGTSDSGRLYYTVTGGETWTEKTFGGSGAGSVHDIVIATGEVLYFAYSDNASTASVYRTLNGGNTWYNSSPGLVTLPTYNRPTRLAVPYLAKEEIAANNLVIGGLAANNTDGILLIGAAPTK